MSFLHQLLSALHLIVSSQEIWQIAFLSFFVSITAVLFSSLVGIPIGAILGLKKSNENIFLISFLNMSVGLPPVLVGLVVYLLISRSGPFGALQLLFTAPAMVIAQFILTLPIVIALTRSSIKNLPEELDETLWSLGASKAQRIYLTINEARFGIFVAMFIAFGRAISEVGAIMIVGGNIRYRTRVLTTAIITEVSKGELEMALALGILLLTLSYFFTFWLTLLQFRSKEKSSK